VDRLTLAYQRVWEAFQRGQSTEDGRHDTPYWRAHTGPYAACIVRVPAEALHPNLAVLRQQLAALQGVRLHPDHFMHLMLQELGFVVTTPRQPDEISEARLEEFAQSIVEPISGMRGLPVTLGGVNSFQDAVFLEVGGGGPLTRLHERLFDLAAMPSLSSYTYLPHCTIAHYDGTTPHDRALSLLAPWRTEVLGRFAVIEAEIVTIDPAEAYPELMTYAVIPFGG
jgi:RNA 2',3'-cyclic 3'-phosphodiesterase